jgi:hypothetical protein
MKALMPVLIVASAGITSANLGGNTVIHSL